MSNWQPQCIAGHLFHNIFSSFGKPNGFHTAESVLQLLTGIDKTRIDKAPRLNKRWVIIGILPSETLSGNADCISEHSNRETLGDLGGRAVKDCHSALFLFLFLDNNLMRFWLLSTSFIIALVAQVLLPYLSVAYKFLWMPINACCLSALKNLCSLGWAIVSGLDNKIAFDIKPNKPPHPLYKAK